MHVQYSMEKEINRCLAVLRKGGTILYPTDTIWGIGCDATDPFAVEKIFRIKRRAESKSLIILLASHDELSGYVTEIPEVAWDLMKNADRPLTIIYPGAKNLASNVVAQDGSVAIRVVRHSFCVGLIQAFGKPIVSTSANFSEGQAPLTFSKIAPAILQAVDHVTDQAYDTILTSKPSSIIKLTGSGEILVIRQ